MLAFSQCFLTSETDGAFDFPDEVDEDDAVEYDEEENVLVGEDEFSLESVELQDEYLLLNQLHHVLYQPAQTGDSSKEKAMEE